MENIKAPGFKTYEGDTYVSTTYWPYYIKLEAKENGEWCPCWDKGSLEYYIYGNSVDNVKFAIGCTVKGPNCKGKFPKTEERMLNVFKRIYG